MMLSSPRQNFSTGDARPHGDRAQQPRAIRRAGPLRRRSIERDRDAPRRPRDPIGAEQDRATPPEAARRIAATAPNGDLLMIEGAGHFPFAETPERYWPALEDWLRRTPPGRGA